MNLPFDRVGHVVLKVRDLERSVDWYTRVLGLREVGRYEDRMAFLSWGENHHDLALMEIGDVPGPVWPEVGMYHFAVRLHGGDDELRAVRDHVVSEGAEVGGASDHAVSHSVYLKDPDGIEIEIYVDTEREEWESIPNAVATIKPLDL
ncbi:MAG: VOC family protein [Actinobacteria bacterium]|nr:VOC family protein [Actinomycetota bacterium]